MADEDWIDIEVAYAKRDAQAVIALRTNRDTTAREAVERSGIQERFPEIDLDRNKIGVFGKVVPFDQILCQGDRVEIYRPLVADPKEARRRRAAEGKAMRKGNARESAG
jgi:putative ubiquitin-RnfH superfamily antitoxin RatB of RatAB toxin-antitoxin module